MRAARSRVMAIFFAAFSSSCCNAGKRHGLAPSHHGRAPRRGRRTLLAWPDSGNPHVPSAAQCGSPTAAHPAQQAFAPLLQQEVCFCTERLPQHWIPVGAAARALQNTSDSSRTSRACCTASSKREADPHAHTERATRSIKHDVVVRATGARRRRPLGASPGQQRHSQRPGAAGAHTQVP
jgi:hypothetical protein